MKKKNKLCTKCKTSKLEDLFYKNKNACDGLQSHCKDCMNTEYKDFIKEHPGYTDKYKGRYKGRYNWKNYKENSEKYIKNNKEKLNIYYADYQRKYSAENKMRVQIRQHWSKHNVKSDIIKPECCERCNLKCRTNLFLPQYFFDKLEIKLKKENRLKIYLEDYQSKIKWLCLSCIKKIRKNE